jgi:ATP-dependent Lon protease
VQSELEKGQREFFLRHQLKAIQDELGESDPEQAEIQELRERREALDLTEDVAKAAFRELGRLERLPPAAAEYGVIRTYLDWIVTLPWNLTTTDNLDLERAQEILDEDHYDHEKVKERIIEHLAVSKCAKTRRDRSSASSARPASARRRSDSRSLARSSASSPACPSEASETRRRSAVTAGRTSARCPARSSALSVTPSR